MSLHSTKRKNVEEKVSKCYLKTIEVLLDADEHEPT